jgi:acetyl/propionyl-CoA carboxylase alpha subunit
VAVDADLRERIGDAALRLARAGEYANAGTVEFLLDETGRFAFLEVNARLQVEHPVTEAVTGVDLVELQLRIASGEPLPLKQSEVTFEGHAIEARLIAEDALAGFLPSSGRVDHFEYPPFVRVDTWLRNGTHVSPYYDSLLAKIVAHGPTRASAVAQLAHAIREVRLDGVTSNVDLLLAAIDSPAFVKGDLHTNFLEEHRVLEELASVPPEVMAAASAVDHLGPSRADDPWHAQTGWRVARIDQPAGWSRAGRVHSATVAAELGGDGVVVASDGRELTTRLAFADDSARRSVSIDDQNVTVWEHGGRRLVEWQGRGYRLERAKPPTVEETLRGRATRAGPAGSLTAPMPGRVVKVSVEVGQLVGQNQPLVVLEAMKMEHVVEAPHAGVVTELEVEVGQQLASGARLLTIGSPESHTAAVLE